MLSTSVLEEGRDSIFETAPEELRRRYRNPWCQLAIFQGAAASVGDNFSGCVFCWKFREEPWSLTTKVLDTWLRSSYPQRLLHIFGWGSRWLGLFAAPGQRAATAGNNNWPGTDVCCRNLIRVYASLVYLGWYQHQFRTLMPNIVVPESTCLVAT